LRFAEFRPNRFGITEAPPTPTPPKHFREPLKVVWGYGSSVRHEARDIGVWGGIRIHARSSCQMLKALLLPFGLAVANFCTLFSAYYY
jgi:hypothetical protein